MRSFIKRLIGKGKGSTRAYDEQAYWSQRSDPNSPAGWEDEHLRQTVDYIRTHANGERRVLEFGPGVGRTLVAHTPGQKITGYDISALYESRVRARAAELGLDFTLEVAKDGREPLPYKDQAFDVGVACQVFLHQRPGNIERVMRELVRVCRKVVVVTGGYRHPDSAPHVFDHDYPALATTIECEMNHVLAWPPHLYFVYQRRTDAQGN